MSLILILIASLLGSPHCAVMCGGFVALSSQPPAAILSQSAYHSGRLVTYLILGFISGLIGVQINHVGEHFGISQIATVVTAILLIAFGISSLLHKRIPFFSAAIFQHVHALQSKILPKRSRVLLYPFCIGLFSTLLPCGWLYTYVAVAAGEASISTSMLVMFFFWLGTLPLLATLGGLTNIIISPLTKYVPLLAALIMIAAGSVSLFNHLRTHSEHTSGHSTQNPMHSYFCVDSIRLE